MREISQELVWTVMILYPKGTNNIRGIGLIEIMWKVMEALIDTRLRSILQLHDVLNGLRSRRGTGIAIVELNLAQ